MTPAARLAAAIDLLADIQRQHRPPGLVLQDWSHANRYAGSKDRSAIGNLVFDVLRNRGVISARMASEEPRQLILGLLHLVRQVDIETIRSLFGGQKYAPDALTEVEEKSLTASVFVDIPDHAEANCPEWLFGHFQQSLGQNAVSEGQALSQRAPLDIRVHVKITSRDQLMERLRRFFPATTPFSPWGVRFVQRNYDERLPQLEAEPSHGLGHFEIQDEGSQLVSLACHGSSKVNKVLDLCAGAGGKTLALAALFPAAKIFAYDRDRHRIRKSIERIQRSPDEHINIIAAHERDLLLGQNGTFDLVLVDAPCTGTGAWRRRPETKWQISEKAVSQRLDEQDSVLDDAASLVRPGGVIVYATCSILDEENDRRIVELLKRDPGFVVEKVEDAWSQYLDRETVDELLESTYEKKYGRLLAPARTNTDGFYISVLRRHS